MGDAKHAARFSVLLVVLMLLMTLVLVAGCGQSATTESTGTGSTDASAPATTDGPVTIVASKNNDPKSLDPNDEITVGGGLECQVAFYERLINITDEKGTLEPGLAESWEVSPDGLTYTFELRQGVKFHDGTEFDAEAVRFTWERIMALKGAAAQYWEPVQDVKVVDPYTVEMILKQPTPAFLATLAGQRGIYMGPSPAAVKANEKTPGDYAKDYFVDHECGTGPYTLVSWMHDQELVYQKFEDYWRGWDGPHVDTIIHKVIKEPATVRLMLENGEVDIAADDLPIELVDEMKGNSNLTIDDAATTTLTQFTFNMDNGPTADLRVRQAIAKLFDYDQAISGGFRGYAERIYGPLPNTVWPALPAEAVKYERDVEGAKQLLAEAGYADGFTLQLSTMDIQNYRTLVLLLQQNLAEANIQVDAEFTTWPVLFEKLQKPKGEKPFGMAGYQMWCAIPDPIDILMWWNTDAITVINPGWGTPETDKMLNDAATATDQQTREELYSEVITQITKDTPAIWVAQSNHLMVTQNYLKGYEYIPYYTQLVNWYDLYVEK